MEDILFSNCSEATVRLNLTNLSEAEIEKLKKDLMVFIIENQNEDNPNVRLDISKEFYEVENDFYDLVYDTSISDKTIWGVPTLTIKGDFPYNSYEVLERFISEKGLEYEYEDE